MQYNDTTNKDGIIQYCERITGLGDTGISSIVSNTDMMKEFTMYANKANRQIWSWIFDAYGGWDYDDANHTDLPIVTTALVTDQQDYAFDSETITVSHVEYKEENSDVWTRLSPITLQKINEVSSESEFYRTSSTPRFYRPLGRTLRLYPAPNFSQSSSLRVHMDRDVFEFTISDTTKTPGFASPFHEAVAVGASIEWLNINKSDSNILRKLSNEWDTVNNPSSWMNRIKRFYQERFFAMFPPRITTRDTVAEFK